jgi:hypothetical protein
MAKLKVETNRDTELIKFEALQVGEVFYYDNNACLKIDELHVRPGVVINAVSLENRKVYQILDDVLVTYIKKAELKLTI